MLIKNQLYEATVTDYTAEGQGVAHIEGCAVFIPNAVAGEKVKVEIFIPREDLMLWNMDRHVFALAEGEYEFMVGASSADIRLDSTVRL